MSTSAVVVGVLSCSTTSGSSSSRYTTTAFTKSALTARDDRFIASSMYWIFSFSTGLSGSK
jgi:hypothetical protein